jgi:para-aminobenzoate synthetase component I
MQPLTAPIQTPLTAYGAFCLFEPEGPVAFLESLPGYGRLSRYSILGLHPYRTLRGWPGRCLVDGRETTEDALDVLEKLLATEANQPVPGLPFSGGCIGYIGYDAGFPLVELATPERAAQAAQAGRPTVGFDFYDNYLIFDHQSGQVTALACGYLEDAAVSLQRLAKRLGDAVVLPNTTAAARRLPLGGVSGGALNDLAIPAPAVYQAKVEAIRELIRQGEVYIANLTQQLSGQSEETAAVLYDRLRRINPAPFTAFIRQETLEIVSASPERFIQIGPDASGHRSIETCPIKGTRRRGRTPDEDTVNAKELLASEKDRSELLMIVDLERNDISRICRPESVTVEDLFRLETYPTVFHLVATVRGILRDDVSAVAAVKACFPGGSITGAPKVAAMQIIDALEDQPRGLYTGCLGYLSLDGQTDLNIIIRTLVKQGRTISYGSGGGITWESDAAAEFQEMLDKAASFMTIMGKEERS